MLRANVAYSQDRASHKRERSQTHGNGPNTPGYGKMMEARILWKHAARTELQASTNYHEGKNSRKISSRSKSYPSTETRENGTASMKKSCFELTTMKRSLRH